MTTECFISVRDVQQIKLPDGYRIVAITDVPCHLWMRWSLVKPERHSQPRLRRGIALHTDVYLCFVAYHDNEQEEVGDTLEHTFVKHDWAHCETRYFHFWGSVAGNTCRSTTALFKKHFTAPELYDYPALYHNRHLWSSHGTWLTARTGFNPQKDGNYQRPNSFLVVRTELTVTWHINRAYINFHSQDIPAGKSVIAGRLGIYVANVPGPLGTIHITKGLWDEPVVDTDWTLQTDEVTSLGSIASDELAIGEYNWIDLNQDGLDWVNQRPTERNQFESYDWRKSAYHVIYGDWRWSQNFTPQTNHTLTRLKLRVRRYGNPGDIFCDIWNTTPAGCPTGDLLAQERVAGIMLSPLTWGDWHEFILDTPVNLVAGRTYAIVLWAPSGHILAYLQWIGATGNKYPSGHACFSDDAGVSWTARPNNDCYFIEYVTQKVGGTKFVLRTSPDLSGVEPPPGYHQEAHFYSAQKGTDYLPILQLTFD